MLEDASPATDPRITLAHDVLLLVRAAKWAIVAGQTSLPKPETTGTWYGTASHFYEHRRQKIQDDVAEVNLVLEDAEQLLLAVGRMCLA